ncbi:hypothetical protein [Streptomyces sp. LaBMicrA B280]|uniref:hypothetical protein n=1 Tax=Streptomyces sp. LaBMicrA B280 TaxID=3391001 RepID=UPI003BA6E29D
MLLSNPIAITGKDEGMAHLHFTCWDCGEDCVVDGEGSDCCDLVEVPAEWDCWNCGALNYTPA